MPIEDGLKEGQAIAAGAEAGRAAAARLTPGLRRSGRPYGISAMVIAAWVGRMDR